MYTLSLKFAPNYKIAIWSDSVMIMESFKNYLYTFETYSYMRPVKGGRRLFTEKRESKMYIELGGVLYADRGLIDYIAVHVGRIFKDFGPNSLKLDYGITPHVPLDLNDKWRTIFANHPRGEDFSRNQLEDFPQLTKNFGGIIEVFTGYGKTEMLLSVADIYHDTREGNIVILAPDNPIKDEILLRAKNYGVPVHDGNWNERINVINPVGFLRSKNLNEKSITWLQKVKLGLTDEAHHLQANSWDKMFTIMTDIDNSYGMSASVDVGEGGTMNPGNTSIADLGPRNSKVVGLTGRVLIQRKLSVPVTLVKVHAEIAPSNVLQKDHGDSWMQAFDQTIINPKCASVISTIFYSFGSRIWFLPIHKKESGMTLYKNLIKQGHSGIMWTSSTLLVDGEPPDLEGMTPLAFLKKRMKEKPCRFMMSTRFEGIDLPGLDAIIPLVGTSHRMTIQPVGRSARNKDVLVALLYDKNNRITMTQNKTRRERMEKEFNIVSSSSLRI